MSKKAKFDFASFDFDSLPAFEPLEDTLVLLRENCHNVSAIEKLLSMDMGELVDHPQWDELLELLKVSLYSYNDPTVTSQVYDKALQLHAVYIDSPLNPHQTVDVVIQLLDMLCHIFLWDAHIASGAEAGSIPRPASLVGVPVGSLTCSMDESLLMGQIAIFVKIVEVISSPAAIGNDNHRADAIKAAVFTLLAHGAVAYVDSVSNRHVQVSLFDCVLCASPVAGGAAAHLHGFSFSADLNLALTSWSTRNSSTSIGVLAMAHQTSFVSLLVDRLGLYSGCADAVEPRDVVIYCSSVNMLLHLLVNFADCASSEPGSGVPCSRTGMICHTCISGPDESAQSCRWSLALAAQEALAKQNAASGKPVPLPSRLLIPLEFVPGTNKKYQQLAGLKNLMFDLLVNPQCAGVELLSPTDTTARFFAFLDKVVGNLSGGVLGLDVFAAEDGGLLLVNVVGDALQSLLTIVMTKSGAGDSPFLRKFSDLYCAFLCNLLESAADWQEGRSRGVAGSAAVREQLMDVAKDLTLALVRVVGEQKSSGGNGGTDNSARVDALWLFTPFLRKVCLYLRSPVGTDQDGREASCEERCVGDILVQFLLFHEAGRPSDVADAVLLGLCNAVASMLCQVVSRCVVLGVVADVAQWAALDGADESRDLLSFIFASCEFYTVVYNQLDSAACRVDVDVLYLLSCAILHATQLLPALVCGGEGGALVAYLAVGPGGDLAIHHIAPVSILYYLLSSYVSAMKCGARRHPQHGATHLLVGITDALAAFPDESLACIMQVANHVSILLGDQLINGDIELLSASCLGGEDGSGHSNGNILWCVMELLYSMISLGWVNEALLIFLRAVKSHCLVHTDAEWTLIDHVLATGDSIALLLHLLFDESVCGEVEMTDESVLSWPSHGFYVCLLRLYSVALNNVAYANAVRERFSAHLLSYEPGILAIGSGRLVGADTAASRGAWLKLLYENSLAIVCSSPDDDDDDGEGCCGEPEAVDEQRLWKQSVLIRLLQVCPNPGPGPYAMGLPSLRDCDLFSVVTGAPVAAAPPRRIRPIGADTATLLAGVRCLLELCDDISPPPDLSVFVARHRDLFTQALASRRSSGSVSAESISSDYPLQTLLLCDYVAPCWMGSYDELVQHVALAWNQPETIGESRVSGETALMRRWLTLNVQCAEVCAGTLLGGADSVPRVPDASAPMPPMPPTDTNFVASVGRSEYESIERRVLKLLALYSLCSAYRVCSHFGVNVRILIRLVLPNWFGSVLGYESVLRLTMVAMLDLPGVDIDSIASLVTGAICCHICDNLIASSGAEHRRGIEAVVRVLQTTPITLATIRHHVCGLATLQSTLPQ